MKPLVTELWSFVSAKRKTFHRYHATGTGDLLAASDLNRFLSATMDEVRLRSASSYISQLLARIDLEDAEHFRRGILRREMNKDISYAKQRDHSAHPLYNYLLGWYVFCHSAPIRNELSRHFNKRGEADVEASFCDTWPFVSVLHDLGYLFEGSLSPLSTALQDAQMQIGTDVLQEYYHHRFWRECGTDSIHERQRLLELSGVRLPDYSSRSMTAVSDTLRHLGNLQKLTAAIRHQRDTTALRPEAADLLTAASALPGDAFDLWESHYRYYGQDSMCLRVKTLRKMYSFLADEGLGGSGVRVLDHGITSGLILLQYSTFYFSMRFGLGEIPPSDVDDERLWKAFRGSSEDRGGEYSALWWWRSIVWATAAVAFHNVLQQSDWPPRLGPQGPLQLEEDPLAYLGILVDCLQEWDRYTVSRESVVAGELPMQGRDVKLGNVAGKVRIVFSEPARLPGIARSLDSSLEDWQNYVEIDS